MSSVRSILRLGAAALACAAFAGAAHAVDIHVGSYVQTGIGAEFATPYDTFRFVGGNVTVAASPMPAVVTLGSYSFEVGPNCYSCTLTPSFDAVIDLTIDGVTRPFDLPYGWYSSGPNDFLTFAQPAPLMFDFGNQGVLVIALDAIATLVSPGGKVYGDLYATASMAPASITPVPEPASYALMLAGFGVVAFVARRRKA